MPQRAFCIICAQAQHFSAVPTNLWFGAWIILDPILLQNHITIISVLFRFMLLFTLLIFVPVFLLLPVMSYFFQKKPFGVSGYWINASMGYFEPILPIWKHVQNAQIPKFRFSKRMPRFHTERFVHASRLAGLAHSIPWKHLFSSWKLQTVFLKEIRHNRE